MNYLNTPWQHWRELPTTETWCLMERMYQSASNNCEL